MPLYIRKVYKAGIVRLRYINVTGTSTPYPGREYDIEKHVDVCCQREGAEYEPPWD
jgi:hypothetical protein